jgi:phospholipase C
VFLVIYDENGGFFDHVAPPTPGPSIEDVNAVPTSDAYDGEYVTTTTPSNAAGGPPSDWYGILGPVGLGFRCPALVLSPFSAGGFVASELFDHVSVLKLIERAFLDPGTILQGLHVSAWRYGLVGDMTSALPRLTEPKAAVPSLPHPRLTDPTVFEESVLNSLAGTVSDGEAYQPPASNSDGYRRQD